MNKPILFNTEMVQAIQSGAKTVTRRLVKPQPTWIKPDEKARKPVAFYAPGTGMEWIKPPYCPGDVLWVRETWADYDRYYYKAAEPDAAEPIESSDPRWFKWRPSIHMPKEAARLFLRVTSVRVEQLQDINCAGALAEGCDGRCECLSSGAPGSLSCVTRDFSRERFETVWDSTIKPANLPRYGWAANPWVWVIEFERCDKPDGWEATP